MTDEFLTPGQRLQILFNILTGQGIPSLEQFSAIQVGEIREFLREKAVECSLLTLGDRFSQDALYQKIRSRLKEKSADESDIQCELDVLSRIVREACTGQSAPQT